jgi:hypothetical protein
MKRDGPILGLMPISLLAVASCVGGFIIAAAAPATAAPLAAATVAITTRTSGVFAIATPATNGS